MKWKDFCSCRFATIWRWIRQIFRQFFRAKPVCVCYFFICLVVFFWLSLFLVNTCFDVRQNKFCYFFKFSKRGRAWYLLKRGFFLFLQQFSLVFHLFLVVSRFFSFLFFCFFCFFFGNVSFAAHPQKWVYLIASDLGFFRYMTVLSSYIQKLGVNIGTRK